MVDDVEEFTAFVELVEPRLRAALASVAGRDDVHDAVAESLVYAWQHWPRVRGMVNAPGYLYRVARSRLPKRRRRVLVPEPERSLPEVEPGLAVALARLPERQRVVVFLIHGLDWSRREVGELLGISLSTVRNHEARGLDALRQSLKVDADE